MQQNFLILLEMQTSQPYLLPEDDDVDDDNDDDDDDDGVFMFPLRLLKILKV